LNYLFKFLKAYFDFETYNFFHTPTQEYENTRMMRERGLGKNWFRRNKEVGRRSLVFRATAPFSPL